MPEKIMQGLGPDELPQPSRQVAEPGVVTTDLGQIMPIPRGVYDPAATYRYLDIVQYTGCSYICRKETLTGVAPIDGANWMLLTDKNGALPTGGGAMTGPIEMSSNRITGLGDPVDDGDAVNLKTLNRSIFPTIQSVFSSTIDFAKVEKIFSSEEIAIDGSARMVKGATEKEWFFAYTIPWGQEYLLAPITWYFCKFHLGNAASSGNTVTWATLCVAHRSFLNQTDLNLVLPDNIILVSATKNNASPHVIDMDYSVSMAVLPPPYNVKSFSIHFTFDTAVDFNTLTTQQYAIMECYRYIPQSSEGGAQNA